MKSYRAQLPLFILVPVLNEIGPEEDPGVSTTELHVGIEKWRKHQRLFLSLQRKGPFDSDSRSDGDNKTSNPRVTGSKATSIMGPMQKAQNFYIGWWGLADVSSLSLLNGERKIPHVLQGDFKSVSMSHIVGMSDIWLWQPESFTLVETGCAESAALSPGKLKSFRLQNYGSKVLWTLWLLLLLLYQPEREQTLYF